MELLPLRPPSEGRKVSWVFWIRVALSTSVLSTGAALQFTQLIPASGRSLKYELIMALEGTVAFELVISCSVRAYVWSSDIGFRYGIRCHSVRGSKTMAREPRNHEANEGCDPVRVVTVTSSPGISIVQSDFSGAEGHAQVAFVFVLPVITFCMNSSIVWISTGIPAAQSIGMITVELFDSLYLFKCMQCAGSIASGAVLIMLDLIHKTYHLWHLHKRVQRIKHDMAKNGDNMQPTDIIRRSMARVPSRSHSLVPFLKRHPVAPSLALGA